MSGCRILLIDDHALFRSGLSMLLRQSMDGLDVREAGSLDEALPGKALAAAEAPAVILLDIQLQGLNGIDGIGLLKQYWPDTPIVMISSDAMPKTVALALERGAAAFFSKADTSDKILALIGRLLSGQKLQDAPLRPAPSAAGGAAAPLTPRQCEVLDLLCQGMPNKAIGRRLGLSENTVRVHVQALLANLRVSNRSEAIVEARRRGLIG